MSDRLFTELDAATVRVSRADMRLTRPPRSQPLRASVVARRC